jgi:hypothetical protein
MEVEFVLNPDVGEAVDTGEAVAITTGREVCAIVFAT